MLSSICKNTTAFAIAGACTLFALVGCDSPAAGGEGGRNVDIRTTFGAPPTIEATSESSRLAGGVAAPSITAQSDRYRLVQRELRPGVNPR